MTQAPASIFKIPTESPQPAPRKPTRPAGRAKAVGSPPRSRVLPAGTGRAATRGGGEVIVLECGITVYPARSEGGRWRAVWYESDERQQCEAATEEKLAARLEKVRTRLEADAPNMTKPGADLIAHYLNPDRLPVSERWSRKHAHTQRRLCERFAAPVIDAAACQDIKTGHMQRIVNAARTAGEGDRVRRMISALVTAGIDAGYLVNSRLAKVHWQAGDRQLPDPEVTVAGESAQWVDPAEIPSDDDIAKLGQALGAGVHGDRDELMANTAAYSGLRWGELTALTIPQVDQPPASSQSQGMHWRSSNFNRNVLKRAYLAVGWRDADGNGAWTWTWHSLRHVFCTTALFTWKLDPTDVARMAGHATSRITLDMYVGATAGVLDRARTATGCLSRARPDGGTSRAAR
jgi:integrase